MSQAMRAYREYSPEQDYRPARSNIRVSTRPNAAAREQQANSWKTFSVLAAVAIVAILAFNLVHLMLDNAAIELTVEAQATSVQIKEARHESNLLEVQASSLANPTRVKAAAAELGMHEAVNPTIIHLSQDIVCTNAQGALSLAGSTRVLGNAALAG